MEDAGTEQPATGTLRNPTLQDVARMAGVAIGTASKALNGVGKLKPETRRRVQEAAEQLGFRPNDLAQSLMRGRTFTVGLLTTDSYGRFSIPVMMGIEDALGPSQISVFLCDARDNPEREQKYVHALLAKRVDGIIVTARRTDLRPAIDLGRAHVPVAYVYTHVSDPDALCILPDDTQGGRLATEHLLQTGRRHLAHITGPLRFEAAWQRLEGMRAAMRESGLDLQDERIAAGAWEERWAREAASCLLARDPEIDGIFCGSDQLARGVLDALHDRGLRVPDDVALVGYDNWEVLATSGRTQITSVDMNLSELGRYAGARLLAMIAGEQASGTIRLPCRLVVRESSGPRSARASTSSE